MEGTRAEKGQRSQKGGGGRQESIPARQQVTGCPVSPQLVYPSDFRLTDKEVGPGSPGSSRGPNSSRPSPGFLCFRKAASATCPFPTRTQVADPWDVGSGAGVGDMQKVGTEAVQDPPWPRRGRDHCQHHCLPAPTHSLLPACYRRPELPAAALVRLP